MANSGKSWFSVSRVATDLALVVPTYLFWVFVLRPFVPLTEQKWILVGALYTAVPMTGVTWMAFHMFRIVLRHEQEKKRAGVK